LFGYCGFSCIYMGYKADITDAFNGKCRFHFDWGTGYLQ
jgi:hypothetical protein